MKIEFLELMKCPYCGTDFKIGDIFEGKEGEVVTGYVMCGCSEFAILEGILNLKVGFLNGYIIKLLKKGEVKKALGLSLWKYSEGICGLATIIGSKRLRGFLSMLMEIDAKHVYKKYSKNISFYNLLGKDSSEIYLKHRFSAETLWSVYSFIQILKNRERILDISCGTGHASFIISTYAKPKEMVCVDRAFRHLYQAKKYFAKGAEFICIDANYPLPFKNNIFDAIFMLDAFHYIDTRASLAKEMERLLLPQGILLLLHLHNSLSYNPAAGKPLSPSGWVNLFQQLPAKALPEDNLVKDFILRNKLDLVKKYSEAELNSCNAISLIGTKNGSLFRVYERIINDFLRHKDNLIINPIYNIDHRGETIILQRCFPGEPFRREYPVTEKYLPEEYIMPEGLCKILNGRTLNLAHANISKDDLHHIEYLMRMFILINVPENYY